MKRIMLVLGAVLFLALFLVTSSSALAATGTCTVSPSTVHVGGTVVAYCPGFAPGEHVTSWLTEPDGESASWYGGVANSAGTVAISIHTVSPQDGYPFALGQYAITVQGSLLSVGYFFVTGSTETVAGATLTTNGNTIIGTGFEPGEVVTVWYDFPNDDCSGSWYEFYHGLSVFDYGNFKANSAGQISFTFSLPEKSWCRGTYHIVARGNSSGLGAETWWTTSNSSIKANVSLVASPTTVFSYAGHISFFGSGFAPNSGVWCWETSPQGQVFPISTDNSSFSDHNAGPIKTDAGGNFSFGIRTGYISPGFKQGEGALGMWAMTCRDGDGNVGIAWFMTVANPTDP